MDVLGLILLNNLDNVWFVGYWLHGLHCLAIHGGGYFGRLDIGDLGRLGFGLGLGLAWTFFNVLSESTPRSLKSAAALVADFGHGFFGVLVIVYLPLQLLIEK